MHKAKPLYLWIFRIFVLAFIVQMFLSFRLWFPKYRSFPQIGFEVLEPYLMSFSSILITTLVYLLFKTGQGVAYGTAVLFTLLCAAADIHSLQIWAYFYALVFSIKMFSKNTKDLHLALILFLAGFYCWSGFHKFNIWYVEHEFPWFFEGFPRIQAWISKPIFAYTSATVELTTGIALVFTKTRRFALLFLIFLHSAILFLLSPWVQDWNSVVFPWNIALACCAGLLLFIEKKQIPEEVNYSFFPFKKSQWSLALSFAFLFAWFLPALSLFDGFEKPLSFRLYTGMQPEATLLWEKNNTFFVQDSSLQEFVYERPQHAALDLADWSMHELNVPPYHSPWALRATCHQAALHQSELSDEVDYFILEVGRWDREEVRIGD